MKILYVQQHFASGKGEGGVRGYNLVKILAERGHDVTVVCGHNWRDNALASSNKSWVVERDFEGVHLVQIGVFYSNHQGMVSRLWSFLLFGFLACYEVLRRKADLVYASSTPLTMCIPAICGRLLKGTPYVFEIRDLWPDLPIEMGIVRNPLLKRTLYFVEWVSYRLAWRLVALAPGIKEGIMRKANIEDSRVAMIPNGSDTEHLRPLGRLPRKHIPVPEEKFTFGYTGTHGMANGLDAVLDAAAALKRRGVDDVVLVLIGDGREKRRLVERAAKEGLSNVSFLGLFNKENYNQVLAELDFGMQILKNIPGFRYGTSPNKFFDYLAVGKPVLVNYPGWMSDLVTQHSCGIAVPPDDPEAFADAILAVKADTARVQAMGRAARQLAESQFSQQKILVDLARFVEEKSAKVDVLTDRKNPAKRLRRLLVYKPTDSVPFWRERAKDPGWLSVMWSNPAYNALAHEDQWSAIERNLPCQRNSVLDLGCGTGRLSAQLAAIFDNYVGVDLDTMVTEARRRLPNLKADFVATKIQEYVFPVQSFDLILSMACIGNSCLADEVPEIARRMVAATKPGGTIIMIDPLHRIPALTRNCRLSSWEVVKIFSDLGMKVQEWGGLHFIPSRMVFSRRSFEKFPHMTRFGYRLGRVLGMLHPRLLSDYSLIVLSKG